MKSSEKWKRIAIAEGILLGIAGLLALLGGLYYRNLIWRGAAEEQAGAEQPVYQFWAHFISFSPREPDLWEQAQSKPVFGDFVFDEKSPRGGLRRRPLAEALAEGKKRGSLNRTYESCLSIDYRTIFKQPSLSHRAWRGPLAPPGRGFWATPPPAPGPSVGPPPAGSRRPSLGPSRL